MRGLGGDLSPPVTLSQLAALLINPGVPLATKDVFARFKAAQPMAGMLDEVPHGREALFAWLVPHGNQLTDAAMALAPEIGVVLGELAVQPGCRLSRMSGSGATCFGLFDDASPARAAADRLSAMHRNWWIRPVTLG
jgi:4-diphosphocytidyl-2-C-methyl-D-erythritol kinase